MAHNNETGSMAADHLPQYKDLPVYGPPPQYDETWVLPTEPS